MGRPVEAKRRKKKKGRPSLLEVQKRSLRLQTKQQLDNPNPNPNPNKPEPPNNPYLRFPHPSSRRSSRRNPNHDGQSEELYEDGGGGDDDDDDERKERKLKLVLRIAPDQPGLDSAPSGSDVDGRPGTRKRPIGDVSREKTEKRKSFPQAGGSAAQGGRSDLENGTPLPDKMLLVFILDRLQKKDTYGVFSEPVDPEELPDYHDIIKHPMDFSTIRKKLSNGVYKNLEQFEKDVFLICSNAMRYNAPDTVYFRQARSMQELAKKDFQNLREESDEDEPEQKTSRRGRPPNKNIFKKTVGRPAADRALSNNSDATLANAPDGANWSKSSVDATKTSFASDKPSLADLSNRNFQLTQTSENRGWLADQKSARNEEPSGSMMRGMLARYGKKVVVSEENRRNTYNHSSSVSPWQEPSILATFDGERKELVPLGLHIGYAYARSLARFAAGLGPVAWEFAVKRIERALPPGMKFGRGWVGEQDAPQPHPPPLLSVSSSSLPPPTVAPHKVSRSTDRTMEMAGASSTLTADKSCPGQRMASPSAPPISSKYSTPPGVIAEAPRIAVHEENTWDAHGGTQPNVPAQLHEKSATKSTTKGSHWSGVNSCPVGPSIRPVMQTPTFPTILAGTQSGAPEGGSVNSNSFTQPLSTSNAEVERTKFGAPRAVNSFHSFFHPLGSGDRVVEKVSLQNSGSSADPVHPASVSRVEADRVPLSSSGAFGSGNSFPQQGWFETERSKNPGMLNVGNGTIHANNAGISHIEAEMLKMVHPNPINPAKDFSHAAAMSRLASEKTETSNSNAINSGDGFTHAPPPSQVELERQKFGNPITSGAGNNFPDSACTSNSETDKTRRGIPSTANSCRMVPESLRGSQGSWRQLSLPQKRDSTPDLNVGFHSPASPPSGMGVDPQQPDLALQL